MAIDPNNPNVVYVGTPQNGLFVTTNGGATWQSVSACPVSQADSSGDYPGITGSYLIRLWARPEGNQHDLRCELRQRRL